MTVWSVLSTFQPGELRPSGATAMFGYLSSKHQLIGRWADNRLSACLVWAIDFEPTGLPMLIAQNQVPLSPKKESGENVMDPMLKRIRQSDEFPSISKYIVEINRKLAGNSETSDASELANLILNDYALTNKLLKLVNSAFYGFAAGKVTTVTRAVVLLGYEHTRLATISLALFEHFKSKANALDLKEAVVSSFWSGMLARDIAQLDDGVDPEEAYVCAMMGQLGKLVMIYYLPDDYRNVCNRIAEFGESESRAVKAACGITYEELAVAVAKLWNFPPQICESLRTLSKEELLNKKNPPAKLQALSNFTKELSSMIQKAGLKDGRMPYRSLLDRYHFTIKISKRQLKGLVKDSMDKVQQHARALNFDIENSSFLKSLAATFRTAANTKDGLENPQTALHASESFQLANAMDMKAGPKDQTTNNPKDIIVEGIQELSDAMMADHDVNDIALMSLEILYRSLQFHRALMFIRDGQNAMMKARFGYGRGSRQLSRRLEFKVSNAKDLFNLSIQIGKDLIVANADDAKISHLIPQWYRNHVDAPAFLFLPLVVQNVCIGAFYADRNKGGQPISETEHRHLSMLRNQLVLAIKYSQVGQRKL